MKIAFLNQPFDRLVQPVKSSISIWTTRVAPYLAKNHEVVVYGRRSRLQKHIDKDNQVEFKLLGTLPYGVTRHLSRLLNGRALFGLPVYASMATYLDYALAAALDIRRRGIDVVHIHNFTQFVPVIRRFNPRVKIVLHMNCEWLSQLPREVMGRRIAQCDLVLGSSNYISGLVRDRFPAYADRCATSYNGVDTDHFAPGPERRASGAESDGTTTDDFAADGAPKRDDAIKVLFVGRISPEKGVHDLIEGFTLAARKDPRLTLDIVGPVVSLPIEYIVGASSDADIKALARFYDGRYEDHLHALIPADLSDRIHFRGATTNVRMVEHYRAADIVANPSYSESFGMSLAEGMSCGVPVVATRVGGMVEIVGDGSVGVLVDRGDINAMGDALITLAADDARRARMGSAGRTRSVSLYSWDVIARKLEEEYAAL